MRWKPELTAADEDADEIHLRKASRDSQANVSSVEVIESIVHQPRRKGRPKMVLRTSSPIWPAMCDPAAVNRRVARRRQSF